MNEKLKAYLKAILIAGIAIAIGAFFGAFGNW